ncbi:hypothetical protein WJX84_012392 [Apatococcus fuscideae]|uniref:Plastid lipid-associated protein/fibrillin conserved domain-containing protein n=1 Tax=Apatococcus fuscideae TaxID=2026836 RepID=A0AAW1SMX5_9CHLO
MLSSLSNQKLLPGSNAWDRRTQRPQRKASARGSRTVYSQAQLSQIADLKRQIVQKAGPKNGLDRSASVKQEIGGLIKAVEGTQQKVPRSNLQGTHWHLAYSTSPGSSGGKLGPFIGWVEQEFPADQPGKYINKLDLGLLKAKLLAEYEYVADNKINVKFVDITFFLGPFQLNRPFSNSGYWDLRYTDKDFRILYTNLGNVFVMEKMDTSKMDA